MVNIIVQGDSQLDVSSSGAATMTRTMIIEGDSMMEIATSTKMPQRGWRHPENTAFYLDTININQIGNKNRKVQVSATLSYSNGAELVREFRDDPWDLGAQNVTSSFVNIQEAFSSGYDEHGREVRNLNTAGCQIVAETTKYVREIKFTYCVKGGRDFNGATEMLVNKNNVTVAGIKIEPMTGLLLPQEATPVIEYESTGDRVKREYWEVSTTIQINKNGWSRNLLNVGTMCYFRNHTGNIVKIPKNIYSYTPWTSTDDATNFRVRPVFGSIDDVIKAKNTYANLFSMSERQQRWDSLPYEEITEPMPLRSDGTLYAEALADPINYPYLQIKIYDAKISSWNSFDLPRDRA